MARYPGLSPIQRAIGGKTGATYGIGVMFGSTKASDGALVVQRLVSGSSAEKSGAVAVGDRLLQVDGVDVIRKPVSYINMMFLGQQGTRVKMILQRPAISAGGRSKTVVVEMERHVIEPSAFDVEGHALNTWGHSSPVKEPEFGSLHHAREPSPQLASPMRIFIPPRAFDESHASPQINPLPAPQNHQVLVGEQGANPAYGNLRKPCHARLLYPRRETETRPSVMKEIPARLSTEKDLELTQHAQLPLSSAGTRGAAATSSRSRDDETCCARRDNMFLSTGTEHCDPEEGCNEPRSRREATTQMASSILRAFSLVLAVVGLGAGVWGIGCTSRWDLMRPAGATPEETCRCLQYLYRFSKKVRSNHRG